MNNSDRLLGFLGGMMLTFGITGIDFENPAFDLNQKEYAAALLGIFLSIIFFVRYKNNRPKT